MMTLKTRLYRKRRKKGFIFLSNERKSVLLATLIISFLLAFVMLTSSVYYYKLLDPAKGFDIKYFFSLQSAGTLLVNIVFFYVLLSIQSWAINKFAINQHQLWLVLVGLLVAMILLSPTLSEMQWWWYRDVLTTSAYSTIQYVKDLVMLLVTFLFTMTIYLMKQNHNAVVEMQDVDMENLRNRYTALKNQTDPHFLFNSLNTLNGLIGEDDKRARQYVQELSEVFRHTMQNKLVVQLSEEMDFVHSYLYLMCIRYYDSLQVEFDIEDKYLNYYMIPSGLQILVENAIKHNIASSKMPLKIIIRTEDDKIIVENKLQLRERNTMTCSGVGLENLMEQYKLIFGKEIEIASNNEKFVVSLPLICSLEQIEPRAKSLL